MNVWSLHLFACQHMFLLPARPHSHTNFVTRILRTVLSTSVIPLKLQTALQLFPVHAMYSLQLIPTISYTLSHHSTVLQPIHILQDGLLLAFGALLIVLRLYRKFRIKCAELQDVVMSPFE